MPGSVINVDGLRRDIDGLLAEYETEPQHVRHVCRLALELYDALAPVHGYGMEERLILETAACLHDIGWAVTQPDGKGHHKESARLIREASWSGLDPAQVALVAHVARYHRKSIPDPGHGDFAAQPARDQTRIRWLAALLRIGDALDRRHLQRVTEATARVSGDELRITAVSTWVIDAELDAADRKADLIRGLWPGRVVFDTVARD